MRKVLSVAAALVLSASLAQAQGRDRDWDDDDDRSSRREHREERGGDPDDYRGWRGERGGDSSGRGGSRFFVRSGEASLRIVCGRGETMRSCVDAGLTLLEKFRPAIGGSSSSTSRREG
jgi:hypothetical protein